MNIATVKKIKEIIKKAGSRADIDTLKNDVPLLEQGLDSLDMFEVFLNLEETFNIKIPDEDVDKLRNIDGIVNYVDCYKSTSE